MNLNFTFSELTILVAANNLEILYLIIKLLNSHEHHLITRKNIKFKMRGKFGDLAL